MGRVVTQGAAELASALFGGSDGYVAYGQGQQAVEVEAPQVPELSSPSCGSPAG